MSMYDIYTGCNGEEATAKVATFTYDGMNPADALSKFIADADAMRELRDMAKGELTEITAFDNDMSASIYPLENGDFDLHVYMNDDDIAITIPKSLGLYGWLSVVEAAEILGRNRSRVLQLVNEGAIDGIKVGSTWFIDRASVEARAANPPSAGRRW